MAVVLASFILGVYGCCPHGTACRIRYTERNVLEGMPLFGVSSGDYYKLGIVLLFYVPQFAIHKVCAL